MEKVWCTESIIRATKETLKLQMMISLKIISDKCQFNRCLRSSSCFKEQKCYKNRCTSLERATADSQKSPKEMRTRRVVWHAEAMQDPNTLLLRESRKNESGVYCSPLRRWLSYCSASHYCSLHITKGKWPQF